MGLRLTILGLWTPKWLISRELDHVSNVTTAALKSLLAAHTPINQTQTKENTIQSIKTVEEKRFAMAAEHTALVQALATFVGQDKAIKLGREALFEVGKNLGMETRGKLGVSNNPKDLIRAATILYRILGIKFSLEWSNKEQATLVVDHCDLAQHYSELTCRVLSATDEGVVKGLDPNAIMAFEEVMTSGCPKCRAQIKFTMQRQKK